MPRPSVPRSRSARHRRPRLALLVLACVVAQVAFADAYTPPQGGNGGRQFKTRCASGQVMAGVELRVGDDVDAIRPLCATATGPRHVGPVAYSGATGIGIGPGWAGGPGGALTNLVCPADHPVVTAMYIRAEGVDTVVVNNVHLYCGEVSTTPGTGTYPAAILDAPGYRASRAALGVGGAPPRSAEDRIQCPAGTVAAGVHGRAGSWLDAVGLICDTPPAPPTPGVRTIGRLGGSATVAPAAAATPSTCDAARAARTRNSPAAAALEARCTQETAAAAQRIGRVGRQGVREDVSVCAAARERAGRGEPIPPDLAARCGQPASAPRVPDVPEDVPPVDPAPEVPPDDGA